MGVVVPAVAVDDDDEDDEKGSEGGGDKNEDEEDDECAQAPSLQLSPLTPFLGMTMTMMTMMKTILQSYCAS